MDTTITNSAVALPATIKNIGAGPDIELQAVDGVISMIRSTGTLLKGVAAKSVAKALNPALVGKEFNLLARQVEAESRKQLNSLVETAIKSYNHGNSAATKCKIGSNSKNERITLISLVTPEKPSNPLASFTEDQLMAAIAALQESKANKTAIVA